jgi:hypothetical protein
MDSGFSPLKYRCTAQVLFISRSSTINTSLAELGVYDLDRVAIRLSENRVHDVVAVFLVYDVLAVNSYWLKTVRSVKN